MAARWKRAGEGGGEERSSRLTLPNDPVPSVAVGEIDKCAASVSKRAEVKPSRTLARFRQRRRLTNDLIFLCEEALVSVSQGRLEEEAEGAERDALR